MMLIVLLISIITILDGATTHAANLKVEDPGGNFQLLTLRLHRFFLLSRNKEEHFTYSISNPDVAEIKNGILLPKEEGLSKITVYDEHKNKHITLIVNILPKSSDTFDQIRQKWKDILLGDHYYDPADSLMSNIQNKTDNEVLTLWNSMNIHEDRENIWDKTTNDLTSTAHMTSEFERLYKLATAVMNKHSCHYLKRNLLIDTISGLEWMWLKKYNANAKVKTHGDWWDWQIGSPTHILNSLIMLYPMLSDNGMALCTTEIDIFVPDPNYIIKDILNLNSNPGHNSTYYEIKEKATGANLVSLSRIKILRNVLRRDEKGIKEAKEALNKILPIVTKGDGFYADGSFLQYGDVPSTGTHGIVVLSGVSEIFLLLRSMKYTIKEEEINKVFTWVNEAFAPLIYNGRIMDMVKERAISREFADSKDSAKIYNAIMNIAELSTKIQVAVYKKMTKQWIANDLINCLTNYRDIYLAKKILHDPSIGTDGMLGTMFKNYAMMNRVAYRNAEKGFALGISMSSWRVVRYEVYNGENKHGWFIGDGVLYLYNGDLSQFSDNFWATVDPYRLPGITVEKVKRKDTSESETSSVDFVGGAILNNQTGMVAMDFVNYDSSVAARKSWTVFNNKIIALGSGIKNIGINDIETIFENRKLNKAIQYKLYINDYEVDISVPFENRVDQVNSIYLESRDKNLSIGYKLIKPQKLSIKVENRLGAWSDINKGGSSTLITRKYLTIWKTHSEEIDEYNYVIYPSITRKEFNEIKPVTLLKNTEYIHAVADSEGNLGVTIFKEGNYSIGDMIITQPMVLIKQEFKNNVKIAVADPTGHQFRKYIIKHTDKNYEIAAIDKNVRAVLQNGVWLISVDPSGKLGQSSTISFTNKKILLTNYYDDYEDVYYW